MTCQHSWDVLACVHEEQKQLCWQTGRSKAWVFFFCSAGKASQTHHYVTPDMLHEFNLVTKNVKKTSDLYSAVYMSVRCRPAPQAMHADCLCFKNNQPTKLLARKNPAPSPTGHALTCWLSFPEMPDVFQILTGIVERWSQLVFLTCSFLPLLS